MELVSYFELGDSEKLLLGEALKALETAYNPYSGFYVGAALQIGGVVVTGSNVENSAYGSTICAERSALVSAYAKGLRKISMLALISKGEDFDSVGVCSPCGSCRQMLFEASQVCNNDFVVIMSNSDKSEIVKASIGELLPLGFGPEDLGVDITKFK